MCMCIMIETVVLLATQLRKCNQNVWSNGYIFNTATCINVCKRVNQSFYNLKRASSCNWYTNRVNSDN